MSVILIIAAAVFLLLSAFMIFRFARKQEKFYLKSTICITISLAVFLALKCLIPLEIPDYVMLFVILAIWIHLFLGYYLRLYRRFKMFDRLLHLYGSFSFSLLVYFITANLPIGAPSRLFRALYVLGWGIALGGIFEIAEYVMDRKNGSHTQRGLKDTDFDLLFDVVGSLAAGLAMYFFILPG